MTNIVNYTLISHHLQMFCLPRSCKITLRHLLMFSYNLQHFVYFNTMWYLVTPSDVFLQLAALCLLRYHVIPCDTFWCFPTTCNTLFTSIPCDTLWHLLMFCYILQYFLTSHDNLWSAPDNLRYLKRLSRTLWYFGTLICPSIEKIVRFWSRCWPHRVV